MSIEFNIITGNFIDIFYVGIPYNCSKFNHTQQIFL